MFELKDVLLFSYHIFIWVLWTLMISSSKNSEGTYDYAFLGTIMFTEIVKFLLSLFFHLASVRFVNVDQELAKIVDQASSGVYFSVPAFIYAVYNALFYFNLRHFDPISYRILINLRILWSGILFQIFFKKRLSKQRWFALLLLLAGCAANQLRWDLSLETSPFFLFTLLIQSFLSSLGGVYNEFLLKKDLDVGLNVKNMYLYGFSIVFYLVVILFSDPALLSGSQLFKGYTSVVYGLVFVGAFCGFSTALFLRHLNILLKEYAHSGEMLFTAIASYFLFGTEISPSVIISMLLVSVSIYLYNSGSTVDLQQPQQQQQQPHPNIPKV